MDHLTRRSVLRGSIGAVAAASLVRPFIANAAAKTATVWWNQGYVPEEDAAFRALVADYEKASGNTIEYSIVPYAPLRQKEVSAITSGVVPDIMESGDPAFVPLHAWSGKLVDVTDVIETQKAHFGEAALLSAHCYNSVAKQRSYYGIPHKGGVAPFHIWKSLVEKAGFKLGDLPNTWDAFLDFFKPVQTKLRAQGMRHVYAYGFEVSAVGDDPNNTFMAFLIAYGGRNLVTSDGKLHTDDPKVREAVIKAVVKLTTPFKEGFAPPAALNWNDADDNNAFHAKQVVIDFDGTLSTELALIHRKEEYDDVVTHGLPLDNDKKEMPSQFPTFQVAIPQGAKNVEVAKDFIKYLIQPKELNAFLKGGLGRWLPTMPELAKTDPWWLDPSDPHRVAYVRQGIFGPTVPPYQVFNPAWAQVFAEHTFSVAEFDVMQNGVAPEQAVDKAFKRVEAIFAKYPITGA
jgi:multiple sugar transport system substrate-binding protein